MDTKEKTISGFIIFVALVAGFFGNNLIDPNTPIWECSSTGLASDCVNGVKADGIRCYWNETNRYAYKNCPEKWILREKGFVEEPQIPTEIPDYDENNGAGHYEVCDIPGCVKR